WKSPVHLHGHGSKEPTHAAFVRSTDRCGYPVHRSASECLLGPALWLGRMRGRIWLWLPRSWLWRIWLRLSRRLGRLSWLWRLRRLWRVRRDVWQSVVQHGIFWLLPRLFVFLFAGNVRRLRL